MIKLLAFFIFVSMSIAVVTAYFQGFQGAGVTTTLASALSSTEEDAMGVSNVGGFASANSRIYIGQEIIKYTGVTAAGGCPSPIPASSPCFTGLSRGVGSTSPADHAVGQRVYDPVTGEANFATQHEYAVFDTDTEQGAGVSLNPITWKDSLSSKTSNFVPTFLTGNWSLVRWIFMFFMTIFVLSTSLLLVSIVRGVRLF